MDGNLPKSIILVNILPTLMKIFKNVMVFFIVFRGFQKMVAKPSTLRVIEYWSDYFILIDTQYKVHC